MTIYRGPGGTGEARTDSDVTEVRIIADEAEGYKDQAAASASAAASSASAAATAETNAETAEANAETAEANAEAAQTAAEAAQAAAEAAQTAAEAAQTAAELAETNAETAEANAETAEANAETAQAAAATSATNAAASASTATTQASNAASSASTATTQAGIATTKASEAASSATAAQSAQTAAESARDSALSAYDNFDDRYLGPKSSDPTLDNDGNALLTGALYYDTTSSVMKVYTGSSWVAAYVSAAGTLLAANNLSDLTSVSTARTNLGLGTAALVADSTLVHKTGDETIAGTKTFSSTITGSITGNAGSVTNGVYTTGDQTIAGTKTLSSNPILSAGTANGVAYLNGSKALTTGSALTFDGTNLATTGRIQTGAALAGLFNTATGAYLQWNYNGTANGYIGTANQAISGGATTDFGISSAGASSSLVFAQNTTEGMRLTSTGLGIGTSSPTEKLTVAGAIRATASQSLLLNGTSGTYSTWYYNGTAVGDIGTGNQAISGGGTGDFGISSRAGSLLFGINGALSMTLNTSGNLGLGVTPSAWYTSFGTKAFQFAASGALFGLDVSNSDRRVILSNNAYDNTSGNNIYLNTGAATRYQMSGGNHYWYNAPSGTAGNAISFTQAMTLDASGNLGVGQTSPGAKLEAAGNLRITNATVANSAIFQVTSDATGSNGVNLESTYYGSGGFGPIKFTTSGTERMRINSSGNVGIGTSSPTSYSSKFIEVSNATSAGLKLTAGTSGLSLGADFSYIASDKSLRITTYESTGFIRFNTQDTERARIDSSGNLLVGTTTTSGITNGASANAHNFLSFEGNVNAQRNNGACFYASKASGYTSSEFHSFYVNGSNVGSITTTGSATAYNTSSDYRLKDITGNLTGYKERVMALQPKQGTWKANGSEFRGFLAHEFAESYSSSVTGEKDAVDADGNPVMQAMQASSSEVMADLVALVQELVAENQSLKARLDAANL